MTDELPKKLAATLDGFTDDEIKAHLAERKKARDQAVAAKHPRATEVLLKEGGTWIVWAENEARLQADHEKKGGYTAVHAVKFEDGAVWDVANGWRGE